MRWPDALRDWPHANLSRQIMSPPHRWHVQEAGEGPTLLLLHGAGGANHSWRDVLPRLAETFHVVSVDLPGHGLTQLGTRSRSGLTPVAQDLLALCASEGWRPACVIGHSAGGATALRMAQLAPEQITRVIGINPALGNFKGLAGIAFPAMAKLLAITPFTADFFAKSATRPGRVEALIASTGSTLAPDGLALYAQLVGDRDHVDGTLTMMSQWSLDDLDGALGQTRADILFITGRKDKTVPPATAEDAARKLPHATCEVWDDLGHLLHEEAPIRTADRIAAWLNEKGLPQRDRPLSKSTNND